MANSGITKTQINTLERALSSDINTLQSDIAISLMESYRLLYGTTRRQNLDNGTPYQTIIESQPETTATDSGMLRSIVLGGLLADPQNNAIFIDKGMLMTIQTPSGADESAMVMARSEGVSDAGTFPFVPNAGAGPRWDLIECRPRVTTTTTTREIFDPVTQQFQSQNVDKIIVTDLEFQYTQGTAASPSPAPVPTAEWQPLACIWVPGSGAASGFDDCEIFDIRPTVQGLQDPANFGRSGGQNNDISQSQFTIRTSSNGTSALGGFESFTNVPYGVPGQVSDSVVSGFGWRPYKLEGTITGTNPGETQIGRGVILNDGATNPGDQLSYGTSGTTWQNNQWYVVKCVFPFGFARFKKFTNYTLEGRRWPIEMSGLISIVQAFGGADFIGNTTNAQSTPDAYDTVGAGWPAVTIGYTRTWDPNGGTFFRSAQQHADGWYYPMEKPSGVGATEFSSPNVVRWAPGDISGAASDIPFNTDICVDITAQTNAAWPSGVGAQVQLTLIDDGTVLGGNNLYAREKAFTVYQPGVSELGRIDEVYLPLKKIDPAGAGLIVAATGGGNDYGGIPSGCELNCTKIMFRSLQG